MTKKFFRNWQERIGETFVIYVYYQQRDKYSYCLFNPINSKIRKIKFNGDYVTIEWNEEYRSNYGHLHSKYDCKTLHRTQIKTIIFKKD